MPPATVSPCIPGVMYNSTDESSVLVSSAVRESPKKERSRRLSQNQIRGPSKNLERACEYPTDKRDNDLQKREYFYQHVTDELTFQRLSRTIFSADESGWYYEECTSTQAKALLQHQPVGTFILRNSSDPKFLFALSVRTERGPTSVRIRFSSGLFQIDCEEHLRTKLPRFENVVELVNFHVSLCADKNFKDCRWLERSGRRDMSVLLKKPLKKSVSSLQHLCRLSINSSLNDIHLPQISTQKLPLPKGMIKFLEEYPFTV